ncbi:uncharacterized protein LOC135170983 isoform X2 [Diachasmimorpha longicaudata]|uniref:uncharacterized protein LOC135170983 isoform X2 n=1 Tax=Diachasmimorpha longicaudata TaxID=58733 RepID=UPI0030B8C989
MKIRKEFLAVIFPLVIHVAGGDQLFQPTLLPANIASWSWSVWEYFASSVLLKLKMYNSQKMLDMWDDLGAFRRNTTDQIKNAVGKSGSSDRVLTNLDNKMYDVDSVLNIFKQKVLLRTNNLDISDLCIFASGVLYTDKLTRKLDVLLNTMISRNSLHPSLLDVVFGDEKSEKSSECQRGRTVYQSMFQMYLGILTIEMKAFIVHAFAHSLLASYNGVFKTCEYKNGAVEASISDVHDTLRDRLRLLNLEFFTRMHNLSTDIPLCSDGQQLYRERETLKLGFTIGTVMYIKDNINVGDLKSGSYECSDIDTRLVGRQLCSEKWKFCVTDPGLTCQGRMFNCVLRNSLQTCLETNTWLRRYTKYRDYTEDWEEKFCEAKYRQTFKKPFCQCQCINNHVDSPGIHVVNLRPVEADVDNNMIVTGIRFSTANNILQFQIQQGKLGRNWQVTDVNWKPIDDISDEVRHIRLGRPAYNGLRNFTENEDFMVLDADNNGINFDAIYVPVGFMLTGVQLVLMEEEDGLKRIAFWLLVRKFDYTTGKLNLDVAGSMIMLDASHDEKLTSEAAFENPSLSLVKENQYMLIGRTEQHPKEMFTTSPFFDLSSIQSVPPSPLGGLQMFYMPVDKNLGIVSLSLKTFDYTAYMEQSHELLDHINRFPSKTQKNIGSSTKPPDAYFM